MRGGLLFVALAACSATPLPGEDSVPAGVTVSGADAPRVPCAYSLAFDGDRYLGSTKCLASDDALSVRLSEQPWSVHLAFYGEAARALVFVPGWSKQAEVVSIRRARGERWEIAMRLETPDGHLVLGEVWATP